jgi:PTS system mannose-specific IIC component
MPIEPGAGFIGAIIVGFLVGYLVKYIRTWKFPKMLKSIVPFLIIPLCVTFVVAVFIRYCIGAIIAQLVIGMFNGLQSLQEQSIAFPIVIAVIVCMMMSIDMGGPINKTANIFATITFYQSLSNVTGQGLSM